MIIYNIIEEYPDNSSNIHSAYYSRKDAERVLAKLDKNALAKYGGTYSVEESCLNESSEVDDLLKQLDIRIRYRK